MKSLKPACFLLFATVVATTAAVDADEIGPQGVSPGAPDRLAEISAACPTFNWEAMPGVEYYELVVYRLAADEVDVSAVDFSAATEVLYITVPGGANGWTPETAACFDPGERYAWFVRAVMDVETGKVSEWSEPQFFEVAAAPSADELERAIEVIRRWEAASGDGSLTLPSAADAVSAPAPVAVPAAVPAAASDADAVAVADSDSGAGAGGGGGAIHPESVITGTAAICGEQPDFSGETYGVVGVNASPDGAGIGASNVTGGPDLVLDGAVPAEIRETGVDRPSVSPQTFSFSNTGGGGIILDVDGAGILTTASAVDAETLDGLDSADFATDVEAAALVATHAASADHDGRYYTKTELGTSGTPDAVHWDNLGGVPAGFADGVDDDTMYSFGDGVVVDGTHIRVDPVFFSMKKTTLDGQAGTNYTSIAIGDDGLGLIAYGGSGLKVAHCDNVLCTSATLSTIDSAGNVGGCTSIAIGADGLGLISYYDSVPNYDLKVAHCDNVLCTSATITTLDSAGYVGRYNSIAIGDDGLGLISYYDNVPDYDLKVAHCDNALCTSATTSTLDSVGSVGFGASVAIGDDDLGIISYHDITNNAIKVAHCDDVECTSATLSAIAGSSAGFATSIAIGVDGLGIVVFESLAVDYTIAAAHCNDTLCTSASVMIIDSSVEAGEGISVAIGADGYPVIGYFLEHDGVMVHDVKVAHCGDARCGVAPNRPIEFPVEPGWTGISIAIGADGLPLVSFPGVSGELRVAHLPYGY